MAFALSTSGAIAAKASYGARTVIANPMGPVAPRLAPIKGPLYIQMVQESKKKVVSSRPAPAVPKKPLRARRPAQSFDVTIPLSKKKEVTIPVELGFTKANELFVGRLAMIGFAASLLGEALTGMGALAQFDIETGLPLADTEPLIIGIALFNVFVAFGGLLGLSSGKFVPKDVEDLEPASFDATRSLARPKEFFGITGFGFSKENELFVGRLAMIGFAASLIGEAVTGAGPLAQFGMETGIPLSQTEPLLIFSILLLGTLAINEGTGKFVDEA